MTEEVPSDDNMLTTGLEREEALNKIAKCVGEKTELQRRNMVSALRTKNKEIRLLRKKFRKIALKSRKEKNDLIVQQAAIVLEFSKLIIAKEQKLEDTIRHYNEMKILYTEELREMKLRHQTIEENLNKLCTQWESKIKELNNVCKWKPQQTDTIEIVVDKEFPAIQKQVKEKNTYLFRRLANTNNTVKENNLPGTSSQKPSCKLAGLSLKEVVLTPVRQVGCLLPLKPVNKNVIPTLKTIRKMQPAAIVNLAVNSTESA